jgi:hypothetical protein
LYKKKGAQKTDIKSLLRGTCEVAQSSQQDKKMANFGQKSINYREEAAAALQHELLLLAP